MDTAGLSEPLRFVVRVLPPSDRASLQKGWVDATRDRHVATAAAFGLIGVHDRSDTAQRLVAGRIFQRIHLAVTARGLALQPLNQVPERVDREISAGLEPVFTSSMAALIPTGLDVVMAFRIGHPTTMPNVSPRRPVDEVLMAN